MKATDSRQLSPIVSRVLKFVGVILILASLIDYAVLLFPSGVPDQPGTLDNLRLQLGIVTQIVDRGVVPLIGLVFLLTGLWVDNIAGASQPRRQLWQGVSLVAVILSSLLGLVFLLLVPLHLNNTYRANAETLKQINQEATQAEGQLGTRLSNEVNQQRTQISALLQDETRLNQALQSGQLPEDQAKQLQSFRNDPQALEKFLNQRAKEFQGKIQTEVRTRKLEAEKRAKTEFLKSGFRVGLSSLLLALGYIVVGWNGLRGLAGGGKAR